MCFSTARKAVECKELLQVTSIIQQLCRLSPAICSPQSAPGVPACSRFLDPLLLRASFPSLTSEFSTNTLNFLQSFFVPDASVCPAMAAPTHGSSSSQSLLWTAALSAHFKHFLSWWLSYCCHSVPQVSTATSHCQLLCVTPQSPQGSKVTVLPTVMEVKNSRVEQADPVCHSTAAKLCFPTTLGCLEPEQGFLPCQSLL